MHRFGLECYLEEDSEQGMLVMDGFIWKVERAGQHQHELLCENGTNCCLTNPIPSNIKTSQPTEIETRQSH